MSPKCSRRGMVARRVTMLAILALFLLASVTVVDCRYMSYERDQIVLGGGAKAGQVTRFVARPRVTKERREYEEELDSLVTALLGEINSGGNRTRVRWQMEEGDPEEDLTWFFKRQVRRTDGSKCTVG